MVVFFPKKYRRPPAIAAHAAYISIYIISSIIPSESIFGLCVSRCDGFVAPRGDSKEGVGEKY